MNPPPTVDLSLPSDEELLAAATPNPRTEAAHVTDTGNPGRVAELGRQLQQAGLELDRVHEQSWQTQRALAGSFHNDNAPVYDAAAHRQLLPAGFADAGTHLHDVGRRVAITGQELANTIDDLTSTLDQLPGALNRHRTVFAAEVDAARGPGGLIPTDRAAALLARRDQVAAQMQAEVSAAGRAIMTRVEAYEAVLASCQRLLADLAPTEPPAAVAATDTSSFRPNPVFGGRLEGGSGFTAPAPGAPSIEINPVPPPRPGDPGFVPAPAGPGILLTPPAPNLGGGLQDGPGSDQRVDPSPVIVDSQRPPPGDGPRTGNVPPPRTLPGFPEAEQARKKTPVQGGGGLRARWILPKGEILEWDRRHGEIEKYDKRGRHLGSFDPDTGKQLKPADPRRKVEP